MVALIVLFACVVIPLAVWGIVDPRGAWRATEGWKYRDSEANEPSEAAFELRRVSGLLGLVGLIVGVVILVVMAGDGDDRGSHSASTSAPPYSPPDFSSAWQRRDIGPGTIVGYDYPSALTIRLVVRGARGSVGLDGTCWTNAVAYEQSNAIVVAVTRGETSDYEGNFTADCSAESTEQMVTTVKLREPLGDRPIVTAAAVALPTGGLTPGPVVRPEPLVEVPEPGVYQPLTSVDIDPAWVQVPLLAGVDSLDGY